MTDTPTPAPDRLWQVIQSDRDAAADLMGFTPNRKNYLSDRAPGILLYERYVAAFTRYRLAITPNEMGWIITNAAGDRFRWWDCGEPDWTAVRNKATRYARREDAEAIHLHDEEAWHVIPYSLTAAPASPEGEVECEPYHATQGKPGDASALLARSDDTALVGAVRAAWADDVCDAVCDAENGKVAGSFEKLWAKSRVCAALSGRK